MKWLVYGIILVGVGAAYVRFAPSDPARWHVNAAEAADPGAAGVKRSFILPYGPAMANGQLEALARTEPRATRLHAQGDGQTWVFRSQIFGFPDYTTWHVAADGPGTRVTVLSRLRFGLSDLGVNSKRIDGWVTALTQGS